ncbi:peroxin Pex23-like-Penicillium chrysogenum [Cordyceps fumosorosea ARSEF 2679]|uniref:Peroxin Pex23-like-Penicillium chrysogenum n=1 Tax=Cordyceps fumosorosea (strain ARSEF 2679) TaxID=1081104 RepID=A0A167VUE3_CORFA|nr:peroxin Pex23-like-Penicillium chrysogenum [Cordyceps fumosorosea ARSEF 2679]OAA62989.1 peroxin Pex23-like-Penicillium chrysogenum [Cordyceps fumosorosea ARSEF 2679]
MKLRSSRRVAGLKPDDFDHEINLVDNDGTVSPHNGHHYAQIDRTTTTSNLLTPASSTQRSSRAPSSADESNASSRRPSPSGSPSGSRQVIIEQPEEQENDRAVRPSPSQPSIEVQDATPMPEPQPYSRTKKVIDNRETAIDILYENERGGFFCGGALFSSKALGGLDPTPWTNEFHKPSLTDINSAVVPDPTWEWAWPEWRVNHQEGVDEFGWEYSFAFSSMFSWHDAKWWNSFVRRRAWIRRRVKKRCDHRADEPHLLTTDYFSVRPASDRTRTAAGSLISRAASRASTAQASTVDFFEEEPDIFDLPTLMRTLRFARIDREKREAVENYLAHAQDLPALQRNMHEIMGLFVFQASRRLLLCHIVAKYNEANRDAGTEPTPAMKNRRDALKAALRHADQEVRKLAYWSDVKHMVASGESRIQLKDDRHKFYESFEGIDQSGPAPPNLGALPGKS